MMKRFEEKSVLNHWCHSRHRQTLRRRRCEFMLFLPYSKATITVQKSIREALVFERKLVTLTVVSRARPETDGRAEDLQNRKRQERSDCPHKIF
jgi:hypothetical protein